MVKKRSRPQGNKFRKPEEAGLDEEQAMKGESDSEAEEQVVSDEPMTGNRGKMAAFEAQASGQERIPKESSVKGYS